jgi:hemolysin activation/secretion protein
LVGITHLRSRHHQQQQQQQEQQQQQQQRRQQQKQQEQQLTCAPLPAKTRSLSQRSPVPACTVSNQAAAPRRTRLVVELLVNLCFLHATVTPLNARATQPEGAKHTP